MCGASLKGERGVNGWRVYYSHDFTLLSQVAPEAHVTFRSSVHGPSRFQEERELYIQMETMHKALKVQGGSSTRPSGLDLSSTFSLPLVLPPS
eukprot:4461779-Pleurochrysis_carterae.AAC.1